MILFHRNILAAITLASVLAAAAACTREAIQPGPEGDFVAPSDFEIGWHYGEAINIDTRTEQSVSAENSVTNLYVLLSDQDGNIIRSRSYWVSSTATSVPSGYDDLITSYSVRQTENGEASSGTIPRYFDGVDMGAYSGQALTFYAVANYSDAVGTQLKAAATKEDIENLSISFTTSGNVNRTRFLMVAKEEGIVLNINDEGKIEKTGVNLELKRVDAKIKFNLTLAIAEAVPGTVDFEDMTYRVHRIPDVTYLFQREKGGGTSQADWDAAAAFEANAESAGYSCMLDDNYQTFDVTESDNSGGTFAFYMRENRPVPKTEITAAGQGNFSSLYAMREAWDTDESINPSDPASNRVPVHGRTFKYAPENATFVEISGNLSYTRKGAEGNEEVFGSVTYIVHLGETGNDPNDQEAVNNYDVRRNVNYNYNMRITGINNFEVEVTTGEELRPGAEGDITVSTNKQITVDAHYARILFQIDRTSIEQGAGWSVSTPIGEVKYDSKTGLVNYPYDYKWVLFAVNRDFGTGSDVMVKFPGIQAYDGGVQFYSSLDNPKAETELKTEIAADMGNSISAADGAECGFKEYISKYDQENYYYKNSTNFAALTDNACLRDVNQLINYLTWSLENNPDIFDESGKVAVTAFCDEYTYIYDPRREDYIHPGKSLGTYTDRDRRLKLWKEYVNVDNRVMNITPMATTEYSPDGNTSLTNSYITITQNSIKSIYNPDMTETAWGLETTNETGKLTHVTSTKIHEGASEEGQRTNNLYDGRTNFLNFWVGGDNNTPYDQTGSISWTDAMTVDKDVDHGNDLNEDYRNAFYACITRNRDLNGNNLIDANEIFWYLAARDQLTGLWIGQGAIDEEAWMYTGNGHERNHLVTSSHRNDGHYWVLWAEEGASVGGLRVGGDQNTDNLYDYRCIRNLGIDISEKQAPESYAKISGGPYYENNIGYYTVDASVINSRALRSTDDEGINLPLGHERSQNNMPYKSFDVKTGNEEYYKYTTWETVQNNIASNNNPCPEGWRVPNQREMLIMMSLSTLSLGSTDLATATSFSFCGNDADGGMYGSDRYGFFYNEGNMTLASGDPSLNVRCVRDNTD